MGNSHVTGHQGAGLLAWENGQMDQEASVWLAVYSGLDQEDNKRKKRKKKKEKGLCVASCVALEERSLGLGSMREFGECSAHGWEKDPGSHYVGRV